MSGGGTLRAFRLLGPDAAAALDWLHVHAEVLGAIEADTDGAPDGAVTVWLDGPLPQLPFRLLRTEELSPAAANATATGLERDRPILVADDLLVRPPWVQRPAGFAGIELLVPRGMAFGSGEHASTKAALRALHRCWDAPPSFGDVGTGSGILALYAVQRRCPVVVACDIEPDSVAAAGELLPGALVMLGGPAVLPCVDMVAANMTAAELHASLPVILSRWSRRSWLVLSGMRPGEVDAVTARLPVAPAFVVADDGFRAVAVR